MHNIIQKYYTEENLMFFSVRVVKQCNRGCKFSILVNFKDHVLSCSPGVWIFSAPRNPFWPWLDCEKPKGIHIKVKLIRSGRRFRGWGRQQGQESCNKSIINLYSGMQVQLRGLDYLPWKPPSGMQQGNGSSTWLTTFLKNASTRIL